MNLIRVTSRRATVDKGRRAVEFIMSTDVEDRAGDTIDQTGWRLEHYLSNPVVLWAHKHEIPAIGRQERLRVERNLLIGQTVFATAEQHPFADTIYRLVEGGFINTGSVAFIAHRWEFTDTGIRFLEHELTEWTVCNVPMNPQALARAASEGVDLEPLAKAVSPDKAVRSYDELRRALLDGMPKPADNGLAGDPLARFRNRAKALSTKIRVRSTL